MAQAKTYADEAKRIIKRFKTRVDAGDSMATEAMNKALGKLKEQQEEARNAMQEKQQAKIMKAYGGAMPTMVSDGMDLSGLTTENGYGFMMANGGEMLFGDPSIKETPQEKAARLLNERQLRTNKSKAFADSVNREALIKGKFASPWGKNGVGSAVTPGQDCPECTSRAKVRLYNPHSYATPLDINEKNKILLKIDSTTTPHDYTYPTPSNVPVKRYGGRLPRKAGDDPNESSFLPLMPDDPYAPYARSNGAVETKPSYKDSFIDSASRGNYANANAYGKLYGNQVAGYNPNTPGGVATDPNDKNAGLFSPYQWGTLGANLAGAVGQLGPLLASQRVHMPTAQAVSTPEYTPERDTEARNAIERNFSNIYRDPNMSQLGKREVANKAYIDEGQQLAKLSENTMNANIRGKAANDELKTRTGLENERNRISTETIGAQKKLSDMSNMSSWMGNLGQVTANTFADAQKENMQLVSLAAVAPSGMSIQKMGNKYYKVSNPGGSLRMVTSIVGNEPPKFYEGTRPISGEEFDEKAANISAKGQVQNIAKQAYGGYVRPKYSVVNGKVVKI